MTVYKGENGCEDVHGGQLLTSGKGVRVVHGTFRCRRGYDLHTTTYLPAVRRTTACLVFHHGLADHSERHGNVLWHLCAALGLPVYTYDVHGHGRSGPAGPVDRALVRTYQHLVDDLLDFTRCFVTQAEVADAEADAPAGAAAAQTAAAPSGPAQAADAAAGGKHQGSQQERKRTRPRIFLLGYSMGGLVTSLAVAETCPDPPSRTALTAPTRSGGHHSDSAAATTTSVRAAGRSAAGAGAEPSGGGGGSSLYEGLMLTSGLTDPLYGNHPIVRTLKVAYVTALSWLAPALPLFKRNPVETGIRDTAAAAAMADDMMWYRGRFKVATVASLLSGCARLRCIAHRLSAVPLYVQHATIDMSCSLPSMQAHLARVRPTDLTMHVIEGAYHDLHHDPETPMLLGRMLEWLGKRS